MNDTPHKIDTQDVTDFAPSEVSEMDLYQKREKIYTRKIEGFYQRIRLFTGWPLLTGFFVLPWINWFDRQSVLFDLPARKFHVLNITFWPQDFSMLAWVLAICAFALFLFTSLFGRIWCGYSCPQTVWTSIFMWIEQKTEGSPNQRKKRDETAWAWDKQSWHKLWRKTLKHSMWLGFAFLTGFTFVGYFTPILELGYDFFILSVSTEVLFWVMLFTVATYLNAGWMREQVCMHMCPYARFQSAMFDKDTLIVSYDVKRGEPRGSRKKIAEHKEEGLGDCIDCELCVQVCPTGIDIRNGLQYECIGCALCIDACDSVMEKMSYPKGLVSYTTEHNLEGGISHLLRFRTVGYSLALLVMCSLLAWKLVSRIPLQLDVIRDRGQLYLQHDDGSIENSYTLKLMNMDQREHSYRLSVMGVENIQLLGDTEYRLNSGEVRTIPVRLTLNQADMITSPATVYFSAQSLDNEKQQAERESRFIVPIVAPITLSVPSP